MEKLRLPPLIETIPIALTKITERIVDSLADFTYKLISNISVIHDLDEREKRALAYALVGDLIASPIPEPFDAPIDVVVQDKIRSLLPEMDKYRRMYSRVAEFLPILELLPNYTISVLATIREKETK